MEYPVVTVTGYVTPCSKSVVKSGKIPYPSVEHPDSELSISAITRPKKPSPSEQLKPVGTHAWHADNTEIYLSQFTSSPTTLISTGSAPV